MTPVFANSARVDTREWLVLRGGRWRKLPLRVRYGLLQHPKVGPVLIDTGYTDYSLLAPGRSLMLRAYGWAFGPQLNPAEQPAPFLRRFGLTPQDISTVIVTHFHVDHISGLTLFPTARFLASSSAWQHISQNSAFANLRHGVFPELLPGDFETRLDPVESRPRVTHASGLSGWDLFGDGSVIGVLLPGHADGHLGLLFDDPVRPLLYATDAQWVLDALPQPKRPRLTSRFVAQAPAQVDASTDLALGFRNAGGRVMLCHDPAPTPFDIEGAAS